MVYANTTAFRSNAEEDYDEDAEECSECEEDYGVEFEAKYWCC